MNLFIFFRRVLLWCNLFTLVFFFFIKNLKKKKKKKTCLPIKEFFFLKKDYTF